MNLLYNEPQRITVQRLNLFSIRTCSKTEHEGGGQNFIRFSFAKDAKECRYEPRRTGARFTHCT